VVDGAGRDGAAGIKCRGLFRGIAVDDIANLRIAVNPEPDELRNIRPIPQGRDEPVAEEVALNHGEARVRELDAAAVGDAVSRHIGIGGAIAFPEEIDRLGQRTPVADAVGVVVPLREVVSHGNAVVGIERRGIEGMPGEDEP
jgi:hypothetical protein